MTTPSRPQPESAPAPGSLEERQRFAELQRRLPQLFTRVFHDHHAPQTIVVIPSLSLDRDELQKLEGAIYYEERLLCQLMLLRIPRATVVYVTSQPLSPTIVDYYLHLRPGVPLPPGDGVLARFAVDFMTVQREGEWHTTAIEINLRKGGTTHPFLMLEFLTDGAYDTSTGLYHATNGNPCYYHATDNLTQPSFVGTTPEQLIDTAVNNDLHFDAATQEGVMFHLIGALEACGKVGTLWVGRTAANAERLYERTVAVLDRASRQQRS